MALSLKRILSWILFVDGVLSGAFPDPFPQGEDPDGTKYKTAYKCQGEEITIHCGHKETIQVIRANYGRFSIAICNKHGATNWSVNCMSSTTTKVLRIKCNGKRNCSIAVNSNVFGEDPCPETEKYVEVHYNCISKFQQTTVRPLPPWFLENGASDLWDNKRNSAVSTTRTINQGEIQTTSSLSSFSLYNIPRKPILVTKPTTPKRIPITTPRSTTQHATKPPALEITIANTEETNKNKGESIEESIASCPPILSQDIMWPSTKKGETALMPCPQTGFARWACVEGEAGIAYWAENRPNVSDCGTKRLSDLKEKLRLQTPDHVISTELAHITEVESLLYRADIVSSVDILRTISNHITALLSASDFDDDKGSYVQGIFQDMIRAASNLLNKKHRSAWSNLHKSQRIKMASSLMETLQDSAFLLAHSLESSEILEEVSSNIMTAISIQEYSRMKKISFPFRRNLLKDWTSRMENSISLEKQSFLENLGYTRWSKAIFFWYRDLHELLEDAQQYLRTPRKDEMLLNSQVMSVSLLETKEIRGISSSSDIVITLGHLISNLTDPVCVFWDSEQYAWSDRSCWVVQTGPFKTVCRCNRFKHYALLANASPPSSNHLSPPTIKGSSSSSSSSSLSLEIAIYSTISLCVVFISILLFKYRNKFYSILVKYDCYNDEKKMEGCPKSQSFYNGVALVSTPSINSKSSHEEIYNERRSFQDPLSATKHLRDVVYMSPQLAQLTNTLKAKKKNCNGEHSGKCVHHTLMRKNDNTMLPEKEVIFRAVSPHGHVYWEINPTVHSSYGPSEGHLSSQPPTPSANVLVNPFAELSMVSESLTTHHYKSDRSQRSLRRENQDEVQRQVQIRDIRSIPVSIKSNDYMLAKIQNHVNQSHSCQSIHECPKQRKV